MPVYGTLGAQAILIETSATIKNTANDKTPITLDFILIMFCVAKSGFEPVSLVLETTVLPLNYLAILLNKYNHIN